MMVSRAATLESAEDDASWARACRKEGRAPGEQILPTAVRSADSPCDFAKELWRGRGQCLEHSGAGEVYLPVLETFGRLCKESGNQVLMAVVAQQAPIWLLQMHWLLPGDEFEVLQRPLLGATRKRMLPEMAEAIEVLTT